MKAASTIARSLSRSLAVFTATAAAAVLSLSCATVQRDMLAAPAADADFSRLEALADESARLHASLDPSALSRARAEAASLRASAPLNEGFKARLAAISGDLALLAGDRAAAASALAAAQAARGDDEWVFLLRSRLADKDAAKEAALQKGLASAPSADLLKAELALLRYRQGRYREAVSLLDDALGRLGEAQRAYYGPFRDAALKLVGAEGAPRGSASYIASERVSLLGMTVIAQEGTDLLDYITGAKAWASGPLFARLVAAGLLGPEPVSPDQAATRGRAAYFLWSLVAAREEKPSLLRAYGEKYSAGGASPVSDLPLGSWFFDAALGCVERELLSLPDGSRFLPESTISGAEFLKAARKAAE